MPACKEGRGPRAGKQTQRQKPRHLMNGARHRAQYKAHHPRILAGLPLRTNTIFVFPVPGWTVDVRTALSLLAQVGPRPPHAPPPMLHRTSRAQAPATPRCLLDTELRSPFAGCRKSEGRHKAHPSVGHETGLWGGGGGAVAGAAFKAELAGAGPGALRAWAPLASHPPTSQPPPPPHRPGLATRGRPRSRACPLRFHPSHVPVHW